MKFFIDDTKPYQDDKFFNEIRNFINEGNFVGNDACPHNNNLKNVLESNFKYSFSTKNDKINNGTIKNLLTTIRNDQNKINITFRIPEKVLTGTKYDIDIILNEPLGDVIVAGGIISHQVESYLKQEINIEPLASGGIFKTTRASSEPTTQIWSGIISHPKGTISFTKSVAIVEKI